MIHDIDTLTWALIHILAQSNVWYLFLVYSYTAVISACGRARQWKKAGEYLKEAEASGEEVTTINTVFGLVANTLYAMYWEFRLRLKAWFM